MGTVFILIRAQCTSQNVNIDHLLRYVLSTVFIPLAAQGAYKTHFGWALIKTLIYV